MKTLLSLSIAVVLLLSACGSNRNLTYFSDLGRNSRFTTEAVAAAEPTIQPGDLLSITVNSLNPEANALFNSNTGTVNRNPTMNSGQFTTEGYQVDKNGAVNFPMVGVVKLGGLTREQAQAKITREVEKYIKQPVINVRFMNFKVTVIGEVNRPATFTVPSDKISILEALGTAGDMTVYGKRENVLIIRENNGTRSLARVNLNSKDILNSPYFYLQQNDVVYVEPDRSKAASANPNNRLIPILTAAIGALAVILTNVSFSSN